MGSALSGDDKRLRVLLEAWADTEQRDPAADHAAGRLVGDLAVRVRKSCFKNYGL